MRPLAPRRGQGTLEYILIFALIAIVLVVAGYIFRKELQNVANQALAKLDQFMKDPANADPLRAKGSGQGKAPSTPAAPKSGDAGKKDQSGGVAVEKPAEPQEQAPDDTGFSFTRLPFAKQVALVGAAIGVAMGVFFFFKQSRR